MTGVSFVIPVRNGGRWIREVIGAIRAQADGRPIELIVVNDGSDDDSPEILEALAAEAPVRVLDGGGRGAAAAINTGVRASRFPIICQVDQDVLLEAGWMRSLVAALEDSSVGAAQGYYVSDATTSVSARVMGLDLEQRYGAIRGAATDHVCTGNAAYRADALHRVGLFDERLGYGYDNDMSYRLQSAGYTLVFCREARSVHRWRESFAAYCRQQYGFGYGRLELVARHPRRLAGDCVSPALMMLHPLATLLAIVSLSIALLMAGAGGPWPTFALASAVLLGGLGLERAVAGLRAARAFHDPAALLFPVLHLARDFSWVAAIVVWLGRRIAGQRSRPSDSMRRRAARRGGDTLRADRTVARRGDLRVLGLIPAHNEAATLRSVIEEIRRCCPELHLLVIDDGSTDSTPRLLEDLNARWLRFPERMGIGSAMRAGLRYAARLGYDAAVRLDGDGQHRADEINRVLAPLRDGRADVVLGSRFTEDPGRPAGTVRVVQRLLAGCLSAITGKRITDPTSGFCAVGSRAVRLLAEHHPTGYPEPELRLFLNRNGLRVLEVPVRARPRLGGRTSLTAGRMTAAGARVLLAMIVVPLRTGVGLDRD